MLKRLLRDFLDSIGYTDIEHMRKITEKYDVISFDIFDTLIKRSVDKPTDVFKIIEEKINVRGFATDRIDSEICARKESQSGEVTLNEIYRKMKSVPLSLISDIMGLECEIEKEVCYANESILSLYRFCLERKKVIIASDMYLPRKTIEDLLNTNGIFGYERLYLSNELNMSKRRGDMYDAIKSDVGDKKIVHIGNSFMGDCYEAVTRGIGAIKIPTNSK